MGGAAALGKPGQLLLALALRESGWTLLAEHESEDVDIEARDAAGASWAVEAKMTLEPRKALAAKDVQDLRKARALGLRPALAFYRLGPLSSWLLVEAEGLSEGIEYTEAYLRLLPRLPREDEVNEAFGRVLRRELPELLGLPPGEAQGRLNAKVKELIAHG